MIKVNLKLGSTRFVDHGINIKLSDFAIFIDLFDQILILIDRFKAIGLRDGLSAS